MKYLKINEEVQGSSFIGANNINEYHFVFHGEEGLSVTENLNRMYSTLKEINKKNKLNTNHIVFSRFYFSDIENQKEQVFTSKIFNFCKHGAVSTIQQEPLYNGQIAIIIYFIKDNRKTLSSTKNEKTPEGENYCLIKGENHNMLWIGNLTGKTTASFDQTAEIFTRFKKISKQCKMDILNDAMRTWIYVRDIDNNYAGMTDSRKRFFDKEGLTQHSHYISSTGIEAQSVSEKKLISMDTLSISSIKKEQIEFMEAPKHMGPTHLYGITFERGTKIKFKDRAHFYVSGTASINVEGDVIFKNDVSKQTERALQNIKSLLNNHDANLIDFMYLLVYVRNIREIEKVKSVLLEIIGNKIPTLFVKGSVCRPGWLVEIEGVAVKKETNPFSNFL